MTVAEMKYSNPKIWVRLSCQLSARLFVPFISSLGCCNCYEFFPAFQVVGNGDGATTPSPSSPKPTPSQVHKALSSKPLLPLLHPPDPRSRAPYGSGDHDDGYNLVFPSLAAFHAWREQEEETQMVEFVKGDTHGSKAVPPRFKDHTKTRMREAFKKWRKKYVKKTSREGQEGA